MERQAAPSILLSILIVCFFAIALYRRDEQKPRPSIARGEIEPSTSGRAVADTAAPANDKASLPGSIRVAVAEKSSTLGRSAESGRRGGPSTRASAATTAILQTTANRSTRHAFPAPAVAALPLEKRRTPPRRQPESAFTTVLADETMADVAKRVYGDLDDIEVLRSVNLDTNSAPNEILPAGMLIRTPRSR